MNEYTQMMMGVGNRYRQMHGQPQGQQGQPQGFGLPGLQSQGQEQPAWSGAFKRPVESGDGFADYSKMGSGAAMAGYTPGVDQKGQDARAAFQLYMQQMEGEQQAAQEQQRSWMEQLSSQGDKSQQQWTTALSQTQNQQRSWLDEMMRQQASRDQMLMQYLR